MKFGKKTTKRLPTKVNDMGERAYKLDPREELVATVLTTFVSKAYYESEKAIISRIKSAIASIAKTDKGLYFLAQLAIYTRTVANMRTSSHLIAGEITNLISGTLWAKRFYTKIVVRPDDMSEIASYFLAYKAKSSRASARGKVGLPNAMRKGFKAKLENLDPYLIDKYKMATRDIGLMDLVNICHPVPTIKNREAYRRLRNGESLDDLYSSKILEKESSKAGKSKVAQREAIEDTLDNVKGMPLMNLVRNLRNIIQKAPESVNEACRQLTNIKKIEKSKLLPFRFATAYNEIRLLKNSISPYGSPIMFESEKVRSSENNVEKVLNALSIAIELSCINIPKLEGNTAILCDHSGSVRGDGGGSSLVSAFGCTTTATIGNLFANMLAYSQDDIYFGMFGNHLIDYEYDRSKGLLDNNTISFNKGSKCGAATENGIYHFLRNAIDHKIRIDNLVIFSDMVIGSGSCWDSTSRAGLGSFQSLFKEFKKLNPFCNVVSVNIRQTKGTSVFDKSLGVTQVAGWSNAIFDIVAKSGTGYSEVIKEIESIVI